MANLLAGRVDGSGGRPGPAAMLFGRRIGQRRRVESRGDDQDSREPFRLAGFDSAVGRSGGRI